MYPEPRSANAELLIGMCEGGRSMPGKDWGGPQDGRSRSPYPDGGYAPELIDSKENNR